MFQHLSTNGPQECLPNASYSSKEGILKMCKRDCQKRTGARDDLLFSSWMLLRVHSLCPQIHREERDQGVCEASLHFCLHERLHLQPHACDYINQLCVGFAESQTSSRDVDGMA